MTLSIHRKNRLLLITLSTFKACFLLPLCPWEWCPWLELRCGILNTQKTTEVLKISLLFFLFFRLNTLTLLYLLARTVALSSLKFVQKILESYIFNGGALATQGSAVRYPAPAIWKSCLTGWKFMDSHKIITISDWRKSGLWTSKSPKLSF